MGVIAKSSFAEFARRNFPNAKLVEFASWGHVLDGVRSGDVDAAYRDEFEIKRVLLDDPSLTLVARSVTLTDLTDTIGIGIAPGASHLAAYVDTLGPCNSVVLNPRLPILPTEIKPLGLAVAAMLGLSDCTDTKCLEPARLFFWPRCPEERAHLANYSGHQSCR